MQDPREAKEPTTPNPFDTVLPFIKMMGLQEEVHVHLFMSASDALKKAQEELGNHNATIVCATRQWLWNEDKGLNIPIDPHLILGSLKGSGENPVYPVKGETIYAYDRTYNLAQFKVSDEQIVPLTSLT